MKFPEWNSMPGMGFFANTGRSLWRSSSFLVLLINQALPDFTDVPYS